MAVGSLALAGFGVDSVIEIVASAVVVWQLKGTAGDGRDRRALRVIATAFALLALYIAAQAAHTLLAVDHPGTSDGRHRVAGAHRRRHAHAGGGQARHRGAPG